MSNIKNLKIVKPNYNGLSSGSYYIRKLKHGWSLYHQSFKKNKKTDIMVKQLAYAQLGFVPEWNIDLAKQRCKSLNKEKNLQNSKILGAAMMVSNFESIDKILFPKEIVDKFNIKITAENEGTNYHLKKMQSHFLKIQKLCKDLKMQPHEYKDNEKLIYNWFVINKVSLDYTQKLISLLNRWGVFLSRINGRYFEPIKPARGLSRNNIRKASIGKKGVRKESHPITPDLLEIKRSKLDLQNYNFLFVTVWFGLRPSELIGLKKQKEIDIRKNTEDLSFLVVYQDKLVSIEDKKRYKAIPILFKEQEKAVEMLKSGEYKAPIYKKMENVFGSNYGLYAGRKGFVDLMLNNGYAIEDISLWLGHTSIETTWTHYKNKDVLKLPSPKKK